MSIHSSVTILSFVTPYPFSRTLRRFLMNSLHTKLRGSGSFCVVFIQLKQCCNLYSAIWLFHSNMMSSETGRRKHVSPYRSVAVIMDGCLMHDPCWVYCTIILCLIIFWLFPLNFSKSVLLLILKNHIFFFLIKEWKRRLMGFLWRSTF